MLRIFKAAHGCTPAEYAHRELLDAPDYLNRLRRAAHDGDLDEHERVLSGVEERLVGIEVMLGEYGREMRQVRTIVNRQWIGPDGPEPLQFRQKAA